MKTDTSTQKNIREYTIDAENKRLGKICTEAASYLLGKDSTDVTRHTVAPVFVTIINVSKMDIPDRKKTSEYQSYSGYPGGRNVETLEHLATRLGYDEVVRRSIYGMLPNNRLKKPRLKNLKIIV